MSGSLGSKTLGSKTLGKFVELARKFQWTSWTEVDVAERDAVVLDVLCMAGFEVHHVKVKSLRGHYRDQDGTSTGETYPINPSCPLTVVSINWVNFDRQEEEEDDYRATIWLNNTVETVAAIRDDEQATAKLAGIVTEAVPMLPIRLTWFGDTMVEPPSLDSHIREDDLIWKRSVIHGQCMGYLDLHRCSDEWRSISCRKYRFHVYVPSNINTFGELRANAHRTKLGD